MPGHAPTAPSPEEMLARADPQRSWREYLEAYVDVVYRAAERAVRDPDEARDIAAEVLRRMAEDWPELLERFRAGGGASFRTWLAIVARNLCIDVRRSMFGRRSLPRSVRRLEAWRQQLYRGVYWEGRAPEEVWEALRSEGAFGGTFGEAATALAEIDADLAPESRLPRARLIAALGTAGDDEDGPAEPESAELEPLEGAAREGVAGAMQQILAELDGDERALLRVYFLDGVGAEELRKLFGGRTRSQVYNRVSATLDKIRAAVSAKGLDAEDVEALGQFAWREALGEGAAT